MERTYTTTSIFDNLCCSEERHTLGRDCEAAICIKDLEKANARLHKAITRAIQDLEGLQIGTWKRQATAASKRLAKAQQ